MNIEQIISSFKNPQTAITLIATLVSAFGAAGILSTDMTGGLKLVLSGVLAVIAAAAHRPASAALMRRAARKAAPPVS